MGLKDYKENLFYNAYPNPVKNEFFFETSLQPTQKGLISIYDISGKLLVTNKLESRSKIVRFNLENLPSGVYYYRVFINGEAKTTKKLILQK